MDEEPQKSEPKIALPIALFIGIIMVMCDLIELIPLAGDILDIVIGLPLDAYLFLAGIRGTYVLIGQIIEAIPIAQELPLWTVGWIVTVVVDRNQKLEKVTELAGGLAGGGEAGAIAGEAGAAESAAETAKVAEQTAVTGEAAAAARVAETGVEVGEGATSATRGAGAAEEARATGRTAESAGEAAEGVESGARESLRDKAVRKLKEKGRERLERGFGGEEGEEEPTEEEIEAELAEEERLAEALGETPSPMSELEKNLFAEREGARGGVAPGEEENAAKAKSNLITMPPRPGGTKDTQDVIAKSRAREAEFERNRDSGESNDDGQDMPRAA